MSIPRDMNEVRDIILGWEKGFDSEEERFFLLSKALCNTTIRILGLDANGWCN